jgi:hypothetical protein
MTVKEYLEWIKRTNNNPKNWKEGEAIAADKLIKNYTEKHLIKYLKKHDIFLEDLILVIMSCYGCVEIDHFFMEITYILNG